MAASGAPSARAGPHPWVATGALLLALVAEGYDLLVANFAAPAIVKAFGISKAEVGPLLSASLLGVLFGAALIGPLGDRLGRKRIMLLGCVVYGALSLLAARATSLNELMALRFFIGLGLGGVLPNALALAAELAKPGREATAAGFIGIGITFGGVVGGLTSAALVPTHGWPSLFVVGGVLPLVIAVLLWFVLPESPVFLASRGLPGSGSLLPSPAPLLRSGIAGTTFAIWLVFVAVLMCVYLLNGWIPLLMGQSGFSPRSAALIAAAYQGGGVAGGVVSSLLLHRRGWHVVVLFTAMACVSLCIVVWGTSSTGLLVGGIVAVGFCVTGTQNAINGAGGASYGAEIRSRGLGWALGVGRIGSVAGPLVGSLAVMLGMRETRQFFIIPLIPLGVAALAALWLRRQLPGKPNTV